MKKILSFLALLMVAFALPNKASAMTVYFDNSSSNWSTPYCHYWGGSSASSWPGMKMTNVSGSIWKYTIPDNSTGVIFNNGNGTQTGNLTPTANYLYKSDGSSRPYWDFNGNSSPSTLNLYLETSGYLLPMTFSNGEWTAEFTSVSTTEEFKINADNRWYGYSLNVPLNTKTSVWVNNDDGNRYKFTGLTNNTLYKVTITGRDYESCYVLIEEATTTPETLYLVTTGNAGTKSATIDGTTFSYSGIYFHAGDQMHLSTSSTGAAGTNYGPSSNTDLEDGNAHSYSKVDSKNWVAPVDGTYDITVDWDNSTFTATWVEDVPTDLHLFADGELKSSAVINEGQFTFSNVELEPGTKLTLSTVESGASGIYTPGSAVTLIDSDWMSFSYPDNGYWVAPVKGTYEITVDWNSKSLSATWVEVMPTDMYLFVNGTNVASSNSESGDFTYEVELAKGAQLVLSTDANGASGTKFTPGAATALVYNEGSVFTNSDSGYWTAPVKGTYTINVSYSSRTLTATWEADLPTLYLYSDKPSWATKIATLNSKTGTYTAVVKMGEGTNFVLSTKNATGVDYNGLKNDIYTHGTGVTTLTSGASSSFSNTNDGCWQAPVTGEYTITVTFDESAKTGTLKATWTAPVKKVHMPLSESDFANGKKHYFLVGNRMGEWRLLPEWEFKVDGNDLVLNNRWIYPGGFAIAVVDSYNDYIKHKYTYYSKQWEFKESVLECTEDFSGTGASMTATGTMQSPSNNFWTAFSSSNGGGDYWQATGTLVTEIRVGLKNGLPSTLKFTVGDKADFNMYRFFTLVGDDIYNNNFCNSYGPATTLQYSKDQTDYNGWQEGWIQYDPVTHEPYVDGNYNYLYHTSYTPDYFKANPSLFNQTLSDGSTFSYTSNEAQFVEYTHLSNLDSDPYKEFYQSFAGTTKRIETGLEMPGNGYNFKVETVNGDFTPNAEWHCYVVRDMWVSGEFKIWTGWGGNDRRSGSSPVDGSVWHGENAGPDNSTQEVEAYDVTSGLTVKLYRNGKNIDGANYKTPSGNLVYYNRVILWYNVTDGIGGDNSTGSGNTPGVGRSFVQFIQESAGPAIFAQLANNPNTSANNYIKYNWYLNAAQNATDSDRQVVGYQIQRYTYVDGVKTFIGYPEGDYVDISEYNVTVADLQQATAGNYSFTTFTDGGIDGISGFAPGMYQYDIVVTFADDAQKKAVSNKVAIYDDNIITPSAYALQLVRLNEDGKTKLGVTQEYLTYNPSVDGNWFVLDVEKIVDGEETYGKPYNADLRPGSEMLEFMMNNQDKYDFTSNFYIRALDKKIYDSTFEEYIREGLVTDTSIPTPTVTASDGSVTSQAYEFDLGDNKFYSAVLFRNGSLENGTGQVIVEYTYKNATGDEVTESPINQAELQPVTPRPYNPTYSYDIDSYDMVVANDAYVAVDNTPMRGNTSFDAPTNITTVKAATNGGKLATNLLVLNVKFNRPNVDEEILANYTIKEDVSTIKDDAGFWFYYADDKVANVDHEIKDMGVSPYKSSIPLVDFFGTSFIAKTDAEGNSLFGDGPAGTFGHGIKFEAPHAIESDPGAGLSGVHLGKIERDNGTWDWMYKGHESLADKAPVLVETGVAYENQTEQTIAPNYYLYELSNGTDDMAYDFLVAHSACDHRVGDVTVDETTGFVLNDEDPLIGTYVVKGFTEETIPAVHVSSIYLFYQALEQYIDGKLVDSNADLNTLAAELPTKDEMAEGNVGGMPDNGTNVTIDGHWRGWSVLGQTYSNTPSEGNVTGVENVLAEGENGEVVYYNLQGIRVDNPSAAGVYVRVQGKDVKKVVIK